jgi:hypothetical protein
MLIVVMMNLDLGKYHRIPIAASTVFYESGCVTPELAIAAATGGAEPTI